MTPRDPDFWIVALYSNKGNLRYRLKVIRGNRAPDVLVFGATTYVREKIVRVDPAQHDLEFYEASVMHPSTVTIVWDEHRNGTP